VDEKDGRFFADDYAKPVVADDYKSVHVYEAPIRIWHWLNVASVLTLIVTGYLIGVPLPSANGEASEWYVMGWIRYGHFGAGYVFAVGILFRLWWGVVGNTFARQVLYLPVWSARWTRELFYQLRWQAFIEPKPLRYLGHNPFAHVAMTALFLYPSLFMMATGFGMYSEGTGSDSWQHLMFGWFVDLWGGALGMHVAHRLGMWVIASFVIIHVYAAVREDIMSGQSIIGTMFNGDRLFKRRF
jgi:Ni/Fe-hydrogenase 1 B-type cytochrome subunit